MALGRGDREAQPRSHTARIGAHRQVDEIADSGKLHDVAVAALDFLRAHSHRQAAEHDIPLTREVVEQRGVDAEKGRLTRGVDGALLRGQQARDGPQQRRFARAVPPDDPDCVAAVGHERNAANGVHFPQTRAVLPAQDPHQGGRGRALAAARTVNAVHDVQVVDDHHRLCHRHTSPSASRGICASLKAGRDRCVRLPRSLSEQRPSLYVAIIYAGRGDIAIRSPFRLQNVTAAVSRPVPRGIFPLVPGSFDRLGGTASQGGEYIGSRTASVRAVQRRGSPASPHRRPGIGRNL